MLKAIILIGGPSKGTRFRPLSLDVPKPLFPVAGLPTIYHLVEAASKVPNLKEVIIIGSYQPNEPLKKFIKTAMDDFSIVVRYLQEYTALGTAGALYHFRDQIRSGNPDLFFVMNGDVCGDFQLQNMLEFHTSNKNSVLSVMGTEATRQQAVNYGCMVENKNTHEITHYVEKPGTFVSSIINCGIYLCSPDIFSYIATAFRRNQENISFDPDDPHQNKELISLEKDILVPLAGDPQFADKLYVYQTTRFWSQMKSSAAAIYANRNYLSIYRRTHPERLAGNEAGFPQIIGDVYIHPSANVHPSAKLGPNVTVSKDVTIGAGVRVRESIILDGAYLHDHSCILHSIVGWHSSIGKWSRVEGTPNDPNPNKPFAKLDIAELFNDDGRLNPSITVIGSRVQIPGEVIVLNSIVLPHKELGGNYKNQIIL